MARQLKRAFDLLVALVLLGVLSPLLAIVALVILLEDGRPILYTQTRAGIGGLPFGILKFRSMRVNDIPPEAVGQVGSDHALVTRIGRFIRRVKIDELPQLLNVLRGELSLVGPRPTLLEQVERYDEFQRRRLSVPPGMTGWAQVNGNVTVSWDERIALDVWYVDHWSWKLDLAILLRTIRVVLKGEAPNPAAIEEARAYADRTSRSS